MFSSYTIPSIFVGRSQELKILSELWKHSMNTGTENFVYVYFNTPGIGKTTLLKQFGKLTEKNKNGIHFSYSCTNSFSSEISLNEDIIYHLQLLLMNKKKLINEYIITCYDNELKEFYKIQLKNLQESIANNIKQKNYTIEIIATTLKRISDIIPVLLTFDEVQRFEQIKLDNETLFHHLTNILAALLDSKILIILSGTQYHILRRIGANIGSPIRYKTKSVIISPFSAQDITDYVIKIKENTDVQISDKLWNHLIDYLHTFSGGHPRTISWITEYFLSNKDILSNKDYNDFVNIIHHSFKSHFNNAIIRSDQKNAIIELQSSEQFITVKNWIISGIMNQLKLHSRPINENEEIDYEIERLVFNLMTTGIIVQNGNMNYYITSYFHFLLFLELFKEEHELFLQQILTNKFIHILVGGHSGLGYTFENIVLSSLVLDSNILENFLNIKLDKFITVERMKTKIKPNILYHAPTAKGMDACILIRNILIIIQITTMKSVDKQKIREFINVLNDWKGRGYNTKGWFISLYKIPSKINKNITSVIFTSGNELIALIGETLYNRTLQIKYNLW